MVVVPFFISDGLHSYEDIPRLLGIAKERSTRLRKATARQATASRAVRGEVFQRNPYKIERRSLFYAPSIGTDPGFVDIVIEQTAKFDSEAVPDRAAKLIAKS